MDLRCIGSPIKFYFPFCSLFYRKKRRKMHIAFAPYTVKRKGGDEDVWLYISKHACIRWGGTFVFDLTFTPLILSPLCSCSICIVHISVPLKSNIYYRNKSKKGTEAEQQNGMLIFFLFFFFGHRTAVYHNNNSNIAPRPRPVTMRPVKPLGCLRILCAVLVI